MRTNVVLLSLLTGLLVGGYPALHSVQAEQVVQTAQPQWKEFSSTEGGFSVLMPVPPTQKRQNTDSSAISLNSNLFTASLEDGKVTYSVSYTNFPDELAKFPPALILDSLSSRFTSDSKIKLLNQQNISLGQYPGKEFTFEAPGEILVKYRTYIVEKRLYQLTTEIPKAREDALSNDTEKFLSSFQLLK